MALAAIALFAGWLVWMKFGTVALYASSQQARLELERLPVPVEFSLGGQVASADVQLGRRVQEGDVLVRLDAAEFELQRAEIDVALRNSGLELAALREQMSAEQRAASAQGARSTESSRAARARVDIDRKVLEYKQKELEAYETLEKAGLVSKLEVLNTVAEAERLRKQVQAATADASVESSDGKLSESDREVRLASMRYSIAQGVAATEMLTARRRVAEFEISRRTIRAPATGTLVDVMPVSKGMTIAPEARLATILPEGALRVVAFFTPQEAIARVHQGQSATLRMDNFPWTQFGTVGAIVEAVGKETRDGLIRVELKINQPNRAIALEHGLTARCEVEVERLNPLGFLLRTAGGWT